MTRAGHNFILENAHIRMACKVGLPKGGPSNQPDGAIHRRVDARARLWVIAPLRAA